MLGTDIVEIERVRASAQNDAFFTRVYTQAEREYYVSHGSRAQTLAGMFCAKEAVVKALGCGFGKIRPDEVEILHDENGKPFVRLRGEAERRFPDTECEISVSHCHTYATAVALIRTGGREKA